MAGGTINFTQSATSGSYIDGKIVWTSELDTSANSSRVIAKLYVRKANTTMTLTVPTEGTWSCKLTVDGKQHNPSISAAVLEDWVLLASLTVGSVKHASNGSKSITISGSITAPSGTSFAGHETKGSGTAQLDFNPRATTIDSLSCSTDYVDGVITAYYTPQSPDYYNRRIVYVNVNGTLTEIHRRDLGKQAASQQPHTMQFDDNELSKIYDKVTNTAKASIRVTFQTYSDSGYTKQIGSDKYREISLSLPASIVPTVALTVKPANSNAWVASKGIYVAGSDVTLTWSSAPGKGNGVKLVSTAFTLNGLNLYDGGDKENGSFTIRALKQTGNSTIVAKATDSRGRSATAPKIITVLPYSAPAITTVQAERGDYKDGGWVEAEDGPDVRVLFKTALSLADNGNTYNAAFKIDGSVKSPDHGATTGLKSGADCAVYFLGLDGEVSHNLAVTVTDSVGNTGSAVLTVPTTYITVEYRANGRGIAFGKTSEKDDTFECDWDADFKKNVSIGGSVTIGGKELDIIVEQGTSAMNHTTNGVTARSGTWTYRKWSSGILECWGVANVDVNINMTWAEPYYYGVISTVNYPFAFTELPVCNVSVAYGDDSKSLFIASCARGTTVYARGIMLCRNTKETVNCDLHYHAIGRWK